MPEDNLAHKVTRTLILLRVHRNATTTYQKLYGRVVTFLVCGELPALWYQITGKYPALHVYMKGQNECCAIRTLTAVVGGGVSEDSGVKFRRNKYLFDLPGAFVAGFVHRTFVMRVHICRHCGEGFSSYPDLRQHLDSHLLPPNVCPTCKRSFTRTADLRRHSSRCRPKPFVCDVCHSSFGRRGDLARHERTIQCGGPKEPESAPKRRKIVEYLHEDTATAPDAVPLDDEPSVGLQEVIRDNWASIRTRVARGPVQTRFNLRLTTTDMRVLNEPLGELFDEQTTAFKVNLGYGFILMGKQSGRFKYYYSSCNCCGRYLEEPALITNRADVDSFLKRIHESDILQWAITQRPN